MNYREKASHKKIIVEETAPDSFKPYIITSTINQSRINYVKALLKELLLSIIGKNKHAVTVTPAKIKNLLFLNSGKKGSFILGYVLAI